VPGTISSVRITFAQRSSSAAVRPTAFGAAPQGTQYSIRIEWVGFIATRPFSHVRRLGGPHSLVGERREQEKAEARTPRTVNGARRE
jgi:hypothetical protein